MQKFKDLFITIEGVDGAGKTTQCKFLQKYFEENNIPSIRTYEPGGEPLAEKIRDLIINDDMDEETQFFLFNAARRAHVMNTIKPALAEGKIVICDRFIDSTFVYQNNIGENLIWLCQHKATDNIYPDLTFIIDLPSDIAMKRLEERGNLNLFDKKPLKYFEENRRKFLTLAEHNKNRCRVIYDDNIKSKLNIHEEILKIVKDRWSRG